MQRTLGTTTTAGHVWARASSQRGMLGYLHPSVLLEDTRWDYRVHTTTIDYHVL